MMARLGRGLAILGMVLLVGLFIVIPMLILVLTSFTGEPIPLLEYLTQGRWSDIYREAAQNFTLYYYSELGDTRRYSQGLINSVGLATSLGVLFFLIGQLTAYLTGFFNRHLGRNLRCLFGWPATLLVFVLASVVCLTWRSWLPADCALFPIFRHFLPGRSWEARLLQTFGFCPVVTLLATALGTLTALCLSRNDLPGRRWFSALAIIPLALPSFLGALALKNLLGINGVVTKALSLAGLPLPFEAQSVWAAVFAQVFLYFPFVLLTVAANLENSDDSLGEAAQVLGADEAMTLWTVRLPLLMPGLAAGAFLVFIRSFGDFSVISLLMPLNCPMIVVEAYRDLSGSTYWGGAAMLSMVMVLTLLTVLALQKYCLEKGSFTVIGGRGVQKAKCCADNPGLKWPAFAFCLFVFSVPLAFVATTFVVSIAGEWGIEVLPHSYTLSRYGEILRSLLETHSPIVNSFMLSGPGLFWSMLLAVPVAWVINRGRSFWRHVLDMLILLPFIVPGVVLAVALICAFNGPPLPWHLTAALVVCAYVLTGMPYAVREISASLAQLGPSLEEGSQTLGANYLLTLIKVVIPLIWPGIRAGAVLVFIACMQEAAITIMTCPPDWKPVSVCIFTEIQEGSIFNASAYGIVLFTLIVVPYAFIKTTITSGSVKRMM